ncbi:MAG: VacJ family lipoprotein, partial [Pseudomonadota bacterium]
PGFFRAGVRNVLSNLNTPVVLGNDILQGEPGRASDTFFRFIINSTVGIGGLWDAADKFGIEGHSEDFGQTLAVWGVPEGPYIVLPLLGSSNLRDTVGRAGDFAFNPLTYKDFTGNADEIYQYTVLGMTVLSAREQFLEAFDQLRAQPEPYVALRRAYTSSRRAAVRNGREEADPFEDLPDFDEFDDFDDFEDDAPVDASSDDVQAEEGLVEDDELETDDESDAPEIDTSSETQTETPANGSET